MSGSLRRVLWVLGIVVLGFVADAAAPAFAQFTIFDFFNQDNNPPPRSYQRRYVPQPYGYEEEDRWHQRYEQRRRLYRQQQQHREHREESSDIVKPVEVAKDANAKIVLVLGDQMADGLAQGLHEAFAGDAKAVVHNAAKEGASLLGKQAGAFLQNVKDKLASENPSAIVVMLGTNDVKTIEENSKAVEFQTERWRTLYLERVDAFLQTLKTKQVPVYWVGLPAARSKNQSGDMAYLNGLYQQKTYVRNAKFVDVWEGFVDEDNNYMVMGPDINGNTRRLRQRDGMSMMPAGNRKLAFYAEKELRHDFAFAPASAAVGAINVPASSASGRPAITNTYVGPVISLNDAQPQSTGLMLLGEEGRSGKQNSSQGQGLNETTGSLLPAETKPGRSDDFSWPLETRKIPPIRQAETKAEIKTETKSESKPATRVSRRRPREFFSPDF
jgi:hypothetical protein